MPVEKNTNGLQLSDVDKLIHEPARYNILALLFVVDRADFLFVQNQTDMTPGNLSAHITKLESAGIISIQKTFIGKKPKTFLKITKSGKKAFEDYRDKMKELFNTPPSINNESENQA